MEKKNILIIDVKTVPHKTIAGLHSYISYEEEQADGTSIIVEKWVGNWICSYINIKIGGWYELEYEDGKHFATKLVRIITPFDMLDEAIELISKLKTVVPNLYITHLAPLILPNTIEKLEDIGQLLDDVANDFGSGMINEEDFLAQLSV